MEEDTEIFRINPRLTAAFGTPEVEALVVEHLDPRTRTAATHASESGVGSAGECGRRKGLW
jgi:hypothetical protein